ncbi:hypothetical protein C343_04246 [Cryptococcus neoformans C23]|uniref:HIT-type domain-containing protein n=2 Tax=Cryptococcus neoformans TaxID=5207 RepID=A0A854Q7X7_CRYNE|nr:hypothetical protein CNAG_05810 [Cryptococcus neoformans var. grubii H99]AUB26011.1 hypothetical protein CKF44_05810 [Cryptococcus neoformans var. grubii]OWZ30546.1 hypothetical protein C347_04306 [Cryptococcus neoformans var. grubii AD2-60a]OWZ42319.1 hypothetical protein C343_04246 [Cryptococcus neoformans var. grubii C23]OXC83677.1 hypothetical protein C344_04000 [Cryptococcus neoformans var. grubii AD1-7a]OXG18331.1 hypothetical protein C361_04454 [Cryptococcus neoformans var. grubii Tu|eukprot:XP_012050378.1 hypothetical protein CNAG_05810 [Cryptococcus neoformans var. grubii H99]
MSIKQPKPLQIRLPFKVPRPNKTTPNVRVCGICRKNDSKYTCPRCNVAYCSLDCFKNESHAQCSEPFYKTTVLDSISADPKAGLEEKRGMMEMLRRFEEAEAEGGNGLEELESEDEEDDLITRLQGVDIDSLDSNELFKLLPSKHRDAFIQALQNPDSEEAQALLESASGELIPQAPDVLPWWESEEALDGGENERREDKVEPEPNLIPQEILLGIKPPEGVGRKLVYNAISIGIAYIHALLSFRLPSLSSTHLASQDLETLDIRTCLGELVPFLVDPKSTVRYESIGSAWGNVWESIGSEMSTPPSTQTLQQLLSIISPLLHPPITTPSYPKLFLILSDIYHLYTIPPGKVGAAVPRKLAFYVKALEQLERREWLELENGIRKELDKLEQEEDQENKVDVKKDNEQLKIV